MSKRKVPLKNLLIVAVLVLIVAASADAKKGQRRNIKAIGEEAVRKGVIKPPPKDYDFTKIPPGADYREGELLVRFIPKSNGKSPTIKEKKKILKSIKGGTLKESYDLVPGLTLVKLPSGKKVAKVLKKFNKTKGIMYAEPNYKLKALSTIPTDPLFGGLWNLNNEGQGGGTDDADIDAPEAWDICTGSSDIVVAVIDTGVGYNHEDLAANMWINPGEDYPPLGVVGPEDFNGINDDGNCDGEGNPLIDDIYGYDFCTYVSVPEGERERDSDPMDDHIWTWSDGRWARNYPYHGTHCAGIIGAVGNNDVPTGITGVCWDVSIMALKFLNECGEGVHADAIACIGYATAMGADVINASWGRNTPGYGLKNKIEAAGAAGILFVTVAGNRPENKDIDDDIGVTHPFYPACFDCDNIITVMATDRDDEKWHYSCYGAISVDLAAPGHEIISCKKGDLYQSLSGTSMAAPHVAGACALLWSLNPELRADQVKDIILDSVDGLPVLAGKCFTGGRLNLYQALLAASPWVDVPKDQRTVTIPPGPRVDIPVNFSTKTVDVGTYFGKIKLMFEDPDNYETTIDIPAKLTVTE